MIKRKRFLYIFFLFLVILTGFFVSFEVSFAQNEDKIELKDQDREKIWQAVKQGLSDELTEISTSGDFKIEDQAVLAIIKQAVKVGITNYLLAEVPKEIAIGVIKTTIKLVYSILAGDPALVIGEIEKLSVEKAKEYAMNWLLQKEIKTSSGNLKISYPDYNNIWQKEVFPYIIVYQPLSINKGEVAIEIYSPKTIRTPFPSTKYQWEGGIEELPPFILRIKGEVEKVDIAWGSVYRWVRGPDINVVFNEPVPELEFKEPGFFDKLKSYLDKTKKAFENLLDLIGIFSSKLNIFQATVGPSPTPVPPDLPSELQDEEQKEVINPEILEEMGEGIERVEEKVEEKTETGSLQEFDLKQAQDILDDIAERIDILSQKVTELVGGQEGIGGPIEPIEELEEEETEDFEEKEDIEKKEGGICVVNINTASKEELQKLTGVGLVIAQKIIEARPFSSIYNLIRVSGVGEITLQKIVEQGCAYVEYYAGGGSGGGGAPPTFYPKILISEIQILPIEQRFIELYNPNTTAVDLTGWYIQRKTETGTSWNSLVTSTQFEGKTIQAKDYFLISRALENSDILLTDLTLTENNSLVLKNPNREIVDKVGWGQAQDFEVAPAENPLPGQSMGRKWIGEEYQDTNNNQNDFESQEPTAKRENRPFVPTPSAPAIPILEVSPQSLEFSIIESATPSGAKTFIISNVGDGSFEWQGIINYATPSDADWLKIEPDFGQVSDGAREVLVSLFQDVSELAVGGYEAEIIITAQGAEGSPQAVEVGLSVEPAGEEEEEPSREIIINEIAWMGTKADSTDEWIEFYNPNLEPVELSNWQLLFYPPEEAEPRITAFSILETTTPTIDGLSYFLLERTNDETVSDVEADYVYTGALNNDGGILELRDANSNLIDRVDCFSEWFAGDNDTKQTMERINSEDSGSDPNNWADNNLIARNGKDAEGNNISGTPKAENSVSKSSTEISGIVDFPTLTLLGSPYIVEGTVIIPEDETLTIEPGVVIKFHGYYSENTGITVNGTLKAIGGETDDEKIVFTSYRDEEYGSSGASHGSWGQIYFSPTSTGSELENIILRYGGGFYDPGQSCSIDAAGIYVQGTSITLKNSVLEHNKNNGLLLINSSSIIDNVQFLDTVICQGYLEHGGNGISINGGGASIKNSLFKKNIYGIYVDKWQDSPATPIIENNIFKENEKPICIIDSSPFFKGNQAANNDFNGTFVSGEIKQDTIWEADLTYIVERNLTISSGVIFTLKPGAVIKVYDYYRGNGGITVNGTLKAIGAENEKIIFTSLFDDDYGGDTNSDGDITSPSHGSWGQIYFSPTSTGSELENIILRYGGGFYDPGQSCSIDAAGIYVQGTSITLKNSVLEHNKNNGLLLINSSSIIDNVQFLDTVICQGYLEHGGNGISINGDSPVIRNSSFKKNLYGVDIQNGEPILENLVFGIGEEANECNIYKDGECINPESP